MSNFFLGRSFDEEGITLPVADSAVRYSKSPPSVVLSQFNYRQQSALTVSHKNIFLINNLLGIRKLVINQANITPLREQSIGELYVLYTVCHLGKNSVND
jgi:hypothetical protein